MEDGKIKQILKYFANIMIDYFSAWIIVFGIDFCYIVHVMVVSTKFALYIWIIEEQWFVGLKIPSESFQNSNMFIMNSILFYTWGSTLQASLTTQELRAKSKNRKSQNTIEETEQNLFKQSFNRRLNA